MQINPPSGQPYVPPPDGSSSATDPAKASKDVWDALNQFETDMNNVDSVPQDTIVKDLTTAMEKRKAYSQMPPPSNLDFKSSQEWPMGQLADLMNMNTKLNNILQNFEQHMRNENPVDPQHEQLLERLNQVMIQENSPS